MNKLIQNWIDAEKKVETAYKIAQIMHGRAAEAPLPNKLRPAEPKDIIEGAILWYPEHRQASDGEDEALPYWKLVGEVLRPNDEWKTYCAEDGCRYGLDGAFVEV